jgi:hypothetical protein
MIDDPLSLLSLGIWLMAAGMWPVGFLFGACSACCDECGECPCPPNCDFTCDTGNKLKNITFNGRLGDFTFDETDFAVDVTKDEDGNDLVFGFPLFDDGDNGTVNVREFAGTSPPTSGLKYRPGFHDQLLENETNPFYIRAAYSDEGSAQGVWQFPVDDDSYLQCMLDVNDNEFFFALNIAFSEGFDECGCATCVVTYTAYLNWKDPAVNAGQLFGQASKSIALSSCSGAFSPASVTLDNWVLGEPGSGTAVWTDSPFACDLAEVTAWANENLAIEIENVQAKDSCCNKCTHAYNDGCDLDGATLNYAVDGFGANTGLDTDIVIPGENLPQDVLPCFPDVGCDEWSQLTVSPREYTGGLQGDCGCADECLLCLSLLAKFNISGGAYVAITGSCCGILRDCDQTELNFGCEGIEWTVLDAFWGGIQDAGLCEQCGPERVAIITQACIEYLQTLHITASATDITPCDCGACCDEGCEDNVAEGGCGNWAGVGTSCCDDPCEEE